ncbi:MAG TPA: MFS transporter [Anaerolineaceae bacterium]|jgi:FSR family fosmidomycin resistance protein-like MFS transporter|nr:MFS transporter [Anaerolineaceae bacterium]
MQKIDIIKTRTAIRNHPLWQTAILSSAHMLNDFFGGMLSPLLPILILNFGLTKFEAGLLNACLQWPSVSQPFFGRLADRVNLQKYIFLLPLTTGVFMSLVGSAPSTAILALSLFISGLSSSIFHAVASPIAGKVSGKHTGRGLSLWMACGEAGWMLSPILIIAYINKFSLNRIFYLIIPTFIVSVLLYFRLKKIEAIKTHVKVSNGSAKSSLKAITPMLLPIIAIVCARSLIQATTTVYIPTYLTEMGVNLWLAGAALSLTTGAGVLGAIMGGIYKDKIGGRPVLFASLIGSSVFFFLFLYSAHQVWQIVTLFLTGLFSGMYLPVALAMVQEYSPENRSFSTGIYQAFLFTIGAIASMIIGYLYDVLGAHPAFIISGSIGLVGTVLVFFIPSSNTAHQETAQEV